MRTRRSPRNQEILFRALFKAPDVVIAPAPIKTDAEIDAILFLSKRTRSMLKRDAARDRQRAAIAKARLAAPLAREA